MDAFIELLSLLVLSDIFSLPSVVLPFKLCFVMSLALVFVIPLLFVWFVTLVLLRLLSGGINGLTPVVTG